MKNKFKFRWSCQTLEGSKKHQILEYILSSPDGTKAQLIMAALSAYYYPLACKNIDPADVRLKNIALQSITDLLFQMQHIAIECSLEQERLKAVVEAIMWESDTEVIKYKVVQYERN